MTTILPTAQIEQLIAIKENVRHHAIDLGALSAEAAPRNKDLETQCLHLSSLLTIARVGLETAILTAAARCPETIQTEPPDRLRPGGHP